MRVIQTFLCTLLIAILFASCSQDRTEKDQYKLLHVKPVFQRIVSTIEAEIENLIALQEYLKREHYGNFKILETNNLPLNHATSH